VFHIVNYDAGSQQCKVIVAFQLKQWLGKCVIMLYVQCLSYLYLHDISSFIFFCYKMKITKIFIYFCKLEEIKKGLYDAVYSLSFCRMGYIPYITNFPRVCLLGLVWCTEQNVFLFLNYYN